VWNYASLGGAQSAGDGDTLKVGLVRITSGTVAITDHLNKRPRAEYHNIDIALRDYGGAGPFGLEASLHLPGAGRQKVELKGAGVAGGGGFNGSLTLDEASLASLQQFLHVGEPDKLDASATGETTIRTKDGNTALKGSLDLANLRVSGQSLGAPLRLDYQLETGEAGTRIQSLGVKIGSLAANVSGTAGPGGGPLDLRAKIGRASITEIARLASLFNAGFGRDVSVKGQLAADVAITGKPERPAVAGTVDGSDLVITNAAWKAPVRMPGIRFQLSPESIRAGGFGIQAGSTNLGGAFVLSEYTGTDPRLTASVSAREASLAELLQMAKAFGVNSASDIEGTGVVTLDVRANGPVKRGLAMSGSGSIANASVKLPALPKPLQVRTASLRFGEDLVKLDDAAGSLGSSNFRGSLSVNGFTAPKVALNLAVDQVDTAALATTSTPAKPGTGQPAPRQVSGTGQVEIGKLISGSLLLEDVKARCKLEGGTLTLDPLSAHVYGGKQTGSMVIDLRPQPARYSVRVRFDDVDADRLMSSTTALRGVITGRIGAQAEIAFASGDSAAMARSMGGKVKFRMGAGKIMGLNLVNELGQLGKFLGMPPAKESETNMLGLSATLDINNGVGSTQDLSLEIAGGGLLSASGNVNLTDQNVRLRTLTVFGREFAEKAGGSRIGGYLTAALLNEKGELIMPAVITGPLANPRVTVDAERLAELKLRTITRSPDAIRGTAEGVVDAIRTGKPGGLIDILSGRKQAGKK